MRHGMRVDGSTMQWLFYAGGELIATITLRELYAYPDAADLFISKVLARVSKDFPSIYSGVKMT